MADTISYFFKFSTKLAAQTDPVVGPYVVPGNPANFYNPIDVFNLLASSVNTAPGFWCLVYTSDDLTTHPALQFAVDQFQQQVPLGGAAIIVNNLDPPPYINNFQILSQGRINHYQFGLENTLVPPIVTPIPPPPTTFLKQANVFGASRSVVPKNYYIPGTGNPAVSTADYYHMDGLYWFRPYDLLTMGAVGQSIAAQRGRYFWITSADHRQIDISWADGIDFDGGYSTDPGIFPPTVQFLFRTNNTFIRGADEVNRIYQAPHLVFNPDDAINPFYIHGEGTVIGGTAVPPHTGPTVHEENYAISSDLMNWTTQGPSHFNTSFLDWSSFQRVVRNGPGDWYSIGLSTLNNNYGGYGKWTSTDGKTFLQVSNQMKDIVGNSIVTYAGTDPVTIAGQAYALVREDNYDKRPYDLPQQSAIGNIVNGAVRIAQYASLVPIDANLAGLDVPSAIRISDAYAGVYPGPTFLQNVAGYLENGILHCYVLAGFFPSSPNVSTAGGLPYGEPSNIIGSVSGTTLTVTQFISGDPIALVNLLFVPGVNQANITAFGTGTGGVGTYTIDTNFGVVPSQIMTVYKGGLWQENIDYYTYISDASAAANAAPIGVKVSCNAGIVTISWFDALPNRTYRVYRGNSSSQATLIGNVVGVSLTDVPPSNQQSWYKVVTVQGGIERGSRVVHTYASNRSTLTNSHINRIIDDGADQTTIQADWIETVVSWMATNGLTSTLMFWADAAFGIKRSGTVVQKIYCLGTTRMPRGGDYTPATNNVTYSATGFNSTTPAPAWTNPNAFDFGYFGGGRFNQLRRKRQITVVAYYKKPNSDKKTLFGSGNGNTPILSLSHDVDGNVKFTMNDISAAQTASKAAISQTADNIAAGTFDGISLLCYVNGVAGTPNNNLTIPGIAIANSGINDTLTGLTGTVTSNIGVLGSGSANIIFQYGTGYIIENDEASFSAGDLIVFEKALNSSQIISLNSLLRTRQG